MFHFFRERFLSIWNDPQRRLTFFVLAVFSAITLPLCWWIPVFLFSGVEDQEGLRFWLFLGRGLLFSLVILALLLYFRFQDARRDWDFSLPWFHNLVFGFERSFAIRDLYNATLYGVLGFVASRAGFMAALELFLLWEIFFLLLLVAELLSDPTNALLASPAGRSSYIMILGKRIPTTAAVIGGSAVAAATIAGSVDLYNQHKGRQNLLDVAQVNAEAKVKQSETQRDVEIAKTNAKIEIAKINAESKQSIEIAKIKSSRWF